MSRPTPPTWKTRNWPNHKKALKRRGSLAIWFDPAMTWDAAPTGKRGRPPDYSDAAIQTCLTLKGEGRAENGPVDRFQPRTGEAPGRFGMALRQTTGFLESLLRLVGLTGRCRTSAR